MISKKNVVLLIPSLKRGGAERVVSRLSKILKDDYNLKVVIFDSSEIDYNCECEIIDLNEPANGKNVFSKFLKSLRRISKYYIFKKKNNIQITYSFGNSANIVNVFSYGDDKKVTSLRGYGNIKHKESSWSSNIISNVAKMTNKRADLIISVSNVIKDAVIKYYGIDEGKVDVVYNGYEIKEIKNKITESINETEKEWLKNKFVFVSMGSYRKEKGYQYLLKSFSEVAKKEERAGLVIIGKGDDIAEKQLIELINNLEITNNVYLAGFRKNPYNLLASCDSYVLSSLSEGFPNALVEAMACKLPIIATDCKSGPKEILTDNGNLEEDTHTFSIEKYGVLVETISENGDNVLDVEESLKNAMLKIMDDTELRNEYIKKLETRVKDFSYDYWRRKHLELFSKL